MRLRGWDVVQRLSVTTAAASYRVHSEDRLVVHRDHRGLVVAVADGAGGATGGALAAELALAVVAKAVTSGDAWTELALCRWVSDADALITGRAGETTLVVVAVSSDGRLVGASVGDSGALSLDDEHVDELTQGQSTKTRVGSGRARPVSFVRPSVGVLLVATDGLLGAVRWGGPSPAVDARPSIADVLATHQRLDDAASALVVEAARPRGQLRDDVALVLARVAVD